MARGFLPLFRPVQEAWQTDGFIIWTELLQVLRRDIQFIGHGALESIHVLWIHVKP